MENTDYSSAIADPFFKAIINKGRLLTNYHGITHPSQPNYVALAGGSTTFGSTSITSNINYNIPASYKNIADLLSAKGVTWKAYNQWYKQGANGACNTAESLSGTSSSKTCGFTSSYVRKHNPFMSFMDVQSCPLQCRNLVEASQLVTDSTGNTLLNDILSNTLPQVAYYIPDLCNDCHDAALSSCGSWLFTNFFGSKGYFSKANAVSGRTLVVVTFDENGSGDYPPAGNRILTVLIPYGDLTTIAAGEVCGAYYSHYSLLQLIEENWNLGNLNRNDAGTSASLQSWGGPICTDTLANCNTRSYTNTANPNNAKCSCKSVGNTCK